ncbi:MAG: hypothetical protein ABSG60_07300 [Terracidiphilus sp.]
MGNDCFSKIPKECRGFGETCFDERLRVAKSFIEKFVERIAPPKGQLDNSNEAWTQSVRGRFIDICPSDCEPRPKNRCSSKGEFLLDYIWEEKDNGKRILLASESEWGEDRYGNVHWDMVEDDFEKLLVLKAPFKVLIFSSNFKMNDPEGSEKGDFSIGFAKDKLKVSLNNYEHHLPGEVYIFIDFPQTKEEDSPGIYRSFLWLSKNYGKAEVGFEEAGNNLLFRP